MNENNLLLDVRDRPPLSIWIMLSLQHVFAMFGATVLVPRLVNDGIGMPVFSVAVAIFSSGLGTLTYIVCTKARSPVYLGSSFAFIAPMILAYNTGGIGGVMAGTLLVGLIYVACSIAIRFAGNEWIRKLLPDEVVGPMIVVIGLGLAGSAISQMGMSTGASPDLKDLVAGFITLLSIIILSLKAPGFLKLIPILGGIVIGYVAAMALGMVDFQTIAAAKWITPPEFIIPFRDYHFDFKVGLTMAAVALVTMSEHIGDHTTVGNITGRDLLSNPGLFRTLLGDGAATGLAAVIGGPANTSYGENASVLGMTKVASVWVTGGAAVIAMLLSFCGKLTAIIDAIPAPVLGGASVMMYGFIAASGLRLMIKNQVDFGNMRTVAIAATMLVFGLGQAEWHIPIVDITFSGMSLAAIFGVLLNQFLPQEILITSETPWVQKMRQKMERQEH